MQSTAMNLYFSLLFFCIIAVNSTPTTESKNVGLPKRSLSAFFWFTNDERAKVRAEYPDLNLRDMARELGRRWAEADAETKLKYEIIAEQDKRRYETEIDEYRRNNPDL